MKKPTAHARTTLPMTLLVMLLALPTASCAPAQQGPKTLTIDLDNPASAAATERFAQGLKIRLTPLETTQASFFGPNSRPLIAGDELWLLDQNSWENRSRLLRFYVATGAFRGTIDHLGRGPGEWLMMVDFFVADGQLHVLDAWGGKIEVYDTSGNHLKTVPGIAHGINFAPTPGGGYAVLSAFSQPYIVTFYDRDGGRLSSALPTRAEWAGSSLSRGPTAFRVPGSNNLIFNLFADFNLFSLSPAGGGVDTLYRLDLGRRTMPESFYQGDLMANFNALREDYAMGIETLTMAGNWVIFNPLIWNRSIGGPFFHDTGGGGSGGGSRVGRGGGSGGGTPGTTIDGSRLPEPWKTLIGHHGSRAVTVDGTVHTLVSSFALRELVGSLGADRGNRWPFLAGLDGAAIPEDGNDWLVSYTIE